MKLLRTLIAATVVALAAFTVPATAAPPNGGTDIATTTVEPAGETFLTFRNKRTEWCIDDSHQFLLRAHPCNGQRFQDFRYFFQGEYRVLKSYITDRCLDDSFQEQLRTFPCNNTDHQRWLLRIAEVGRVYLINQATGRCVDHSFEFRLRAHPCNQQDFQKWFFTNHG